MKRDIQKEHAQSCDMLHHHDELVERVVHEMPPEEDLYDLADFFKVFADTTRIKILYVLLKQEMCVCDIAQTLEMTQSAISHQLRILKQMDLVKNRRDGKIIYYSLADNHIVSILSQGMDHINE
ncbi:MAG: helix-turn-helix transcriptional regulator [Lachnospiraceae bacterium]|nr:helix-turn-helix transcriptional regulator [Lachnospiraceae bacterium]